MREIEFRGKRVDNGTWVYGDFCKPCNIVWLKEDKELNDLTIFDEKVQEETIGQYTGLKDKNENKIFAGDIVRQTMTVNGEIVQRVAKIVFDDGGYWLLYPNNQIFRLMQNTIDIYELEVIGNIYDNPELLENQSE